MATAGPEKLSPLLNVTDQVPVNPFGAWPSSDNRAVPSPETASRIDPDQLPAGVLAEGVVGGAGVELPPQAATLSIAATTGASRRFMARSVQSIMLQESPEVVKPSTEPVAGDGGGAHPAHLRSWTTRIGRSPARRNGTTISATFEYRRFLLSSHC